MSKVTIITHPDCLKHVMYEGHSECPEHLKSIDDHLISSGLSDSLNYIKAPLVKREHIELAHNNDYIDAIFENAPKEGFFQIDPDTTMGKYTLNAILRAVGSVVEGVDKVMSDNKTPVFCNIRPPGHHAEYEVGMGFCFFNSIAIGALYAIKQYGLSRVAIVDFDVHHGNGTEDIVGDNPQVLYCSTYQDPLYPGGTGESREGLVVNVPLDPGANSQAFRQGVKEYLLPALDQFSPEIIFISAGFDAHKEDHLASLELVECDYSWITHELCQLADKHANGRIVSVLEGGYALSALGRSAVAHIKALMHA